MDTHTSTGNKSPHCGNPLVAIVIVNYRNLSDTIACVASLKRVSYANYRVILVDNHSPGNDGAELQRAFGSEHVVICTGKNLGYGGGANIGIRAALQFKPDYILGLNNDTIVEPDFMGAMVRVAESDPRIGLVTSRIVSESDRQSLESIGMIMRWNGLASQRLSEKDPLFCPSGACVLYRTAMVEEIKLGDEYFDEDFFLFGEDVDFCFRGLLMGYRCACAPDAVIYHKGSVTTGRQSDLSVYYGHRNMPLLIWKDFPTAHLWRFGLGIILFQLLAVPYYLLTDVRHLPLLIKSKFDALHLMPKLSRKRAAIQSKRRISDKELRSLYA